MSEREAKSKDINLLHFFFLKRTLVLFKSGPRRLLGQQLWGQTRPWGQTSGIEQSGSIQPDRR